MDLSQVPDDVRLLLEKRDQPKILNPVTNLICAQEFYVFAKQDEEYTRELPDWNEETKM